MFYQKNSRHLFFSFVCSSCFFLLLSFVFVCWFVAFVAVQSFSTLFYDSLSLLKPQKSLLSFFRIVKLDVRLVDIRCATTKSAESDSLCFLFAYSRDFFDLLPPSRSPTSGTVSDPSRRHPARQYLVEVESRQTLVVGRDFN